MAVNIPGDIGLEDAFGNIVKAKEDVSIQGFLMLIANNISESDLKRTFCLQFIDPYGDTTFNYIQIPVLLSELRVLLENCQTKEEKVKIHSIINFILNDGIGYYVKFFGD